ncbi:hypothetical protein [Bacillus sp. AK128]
MNITRNDKGLVYLDKKAINAIFDCVYGIDEHLSRSTKEMLKEPMFKNLVELLIKHKDFNYYYRQDQVRELFPLADQAMGPFEVNSDGTTIWLSLCLGIKEVYGFRRETLSKVLELVEVRK